MNNRNNFFDNTYSYSNQNTYTQGISFSSYIAKTYLWMFLGLGITFGLSFFMTLKSASVIDFITNNFELYLGGVIASFIFVVIIGFLVYKLPPMAAKIIFILYSADMGIILTPILLLYEFGSVIGVFAATAGIYLVLALIGLTTQRDMSKLGSILGISLLGILIYSLISYFFIRTPLNDLIINIIVIVIFMGFTVFDNFKIKKEFARLQYADSRLLEKASILSALSLYMDYVHLFSRILAIFGKRRD
ncbi:MAG: Bax inhibitor-1/YccA family protein [Clostridia bacterium]|nr:Bax inhibitor-1/YccA family protein [Clostridia bacterium]